MNEDKPLVEHLRELRQRALRVLILLCIVFPVSFYFSPNLLSIFWAKVGEEAYVFSPLELILVRLYFSLLISLVLCYPYAIFELYQFAKPGLYEHERKFLKSILIPSYIIFIFAIYISYEFILPFLYSMGSFEPYYSLSKTMNNVIRITIALGFLLQVPLAMVLLEKFRIVSYKTMKGLRIPVYLLFLIFLANSQIEMGSIALLLLTFGFISMFEISLLLLKIQQTIYRSSKSED